VPQDGVEGFELDLQEPVDIDNGQQRSGGVLGLSTHGAATVSETQRESAVSVDL
jgi:hypothetical protein